MSRDARKTLFHPFETGVLDLPTAAERVLFLGAAPGPSLPDGFGGELICVQGFKPAFNALRRAGYDVSPELSGKGFDVGLVLCGRHRGLNELRVADALARSRPDGLVVVAGDKEDGIASLRKRVEAILPVEGGLSKHHGMAFWFRRSGSAEEAVRALRVANGPALVEERFAAAPGMFSHDRVDVGSKMLTDLLPADLEGRVADFCAGWGYLAVRVADRCPTVSRIDLYEADHASLEAARTNMRALAPDVDARFFWHDLAEEPVGERYDGVVMNPPFHAGRAAEPQLGRALIRSAAGALKPGGRLLVVANRQLPYEQALAASFRSVEKLSEEGGFKVFSARR